MAPQQRYSNNVCIEIGHTDFLNPEFYADLKKCEFTVMAKCTQIVTCKIFTINLVKFVALKNVNFPKICIYVKMLNFFLYISHIGNKKFTTFMLILKKVSLP
jgi:hypothetical protein